MYSPPLRFCRFTLARFATAIAAIAALAWPLAAMAGLYKCARDDGTVMYQEDPCPSGRELRDFERDPATVSVVPFSAPPQNSTEAAAVWEELHLTPREFRPQHGVAKIRR